MRSTNSITLSAAQVVVEVARAKATEIGVPMNIAVVDVAAMLVRMPVTDSASRERQYPSPGVGTVREGRELHYPRGALSG